MRDEIRVDAVPSNLEGVVQPPPLDWTPEAEYPWYSSRDVAIVLAPNSGKEDSLGRVLHRVRLEHRRSGVTVAGQGVDLDDVKRALTKLLCERVQARLDEVTAKARGAGGEDRRR